MRNGARGFTLVELLVAMAILSVIVVLCGQIFEQATSTWNTGVRKAEMNMSGRAVADFIAQDISRCVPKPAPQFGANPVFWIIDEASVPDNSKALRKISYSFGNPPMRQVDTLASVALTPKDLVESIDLQPNLEAGYVDVTVTVKDPVASSYTKGFKARAWLANRDRYSYED